MRKAERKVYEKSMKVQRIMLEVGKHYHAWMQEDYTTARWIRLFSKRIERMMKIIYD